MLRRLLFIAPAASGKYQAAWLCSAWVHPPPCTTWTGDVFPPLGVEQRWFCTLGCCCSLWCRSGVTAVETRPGGSHRASACPAALTG